MMSKNTLYVRRPGVYILLFAFFIAAGVSLTSAQKKKSGKNQRVPAKVANMVWPLPPETPRVKYVGSLYNNMDVEPPKKKGWLKKLINEEETLHIVGLKGPAGIAVDSKERIYIADTLKGGVFIFDLKNKTLNLLGFEGRGKLSNPFGIAIDKNDNIYVSDTRLKQVNVYDSEGNLIGAVTKVGNEQIDNPTGLAVDDNNGRLYIADSRGHKVFVVDLNQLNKGSSFGKKGEGDTEFYYPNYVAVDKEGKIYVADTMNFCIKIFDKDFKFIKRIGEHGVGLGMFDRPKGIALDSEGHIYVVDASFSNFQIFNFDGHLLLFVGAYGSDPGSFRLPSGIFIDKKDQIYVSDRVNSRIQIFQFLGGK